MKKIATIFAVILIVILTAFALGNLKNDNDPTQSSGVFQSSHNTIGLFSLQYRIYAPMHCLVTLDGKAVPYNDTINCYAAEIKKQGKYLLSVSREGCKSFETEITADKDNYEISIDLEYTAEFLQEAEKKAETLLTDIIKKCWELDYDLSAYSFYSQTDKNRLDTVISSVISGLESGLSAEYSVSELTVNMIPSQNSGEDSLCRHDTVENPLMFSFMTEYTYTWEYKGDSYSDSGVQSKIHKPYIVIEKIDGIWYIRDLYLNLSNSSI